MKSIILIDTFDLGGAEKQAIQFANYLQKKHNHKAEIWAWKNGNSTAIPIIQKYNLKTNIIPKFSGWAKTLYPLQAKKYIKLFKKAKPDYLLGYTVRPNELLSYIWKKTGAKNFIWGQQGIELNHKYNLPAQIKGIKNTPVFISNSINGAKYLESFVKAPKEKIHVLYNGITDYKAKNTSEYWRGILKLDSVEFSAIMVGHFAKRKDHVTMIKAWKIVHDELKSQNISCKLTLAGNFNNRVQPIIDLAMDLEVFHSINFVGQIQDIAGLNSAHDIHILSSITEGLPNSLIEAMASKKPVVGTNIDGISEALGEQNLQNLSKLKDPKSLAKVILKFALNRDHIQEIGEKNSKRVDNVFNFQKMCDSTYNLLTNS